jgi:hypothetical protein
MERERMENSTTYKHEATRQATLKNIDDAENQG